MLKIKYSYIILLVIFSSVTGFSQVWQDGPGGLMIGDQKAFAVTMDKWSDIIVTGYSTSVTSGSDFCTIMYNKNGIQQWIAYYNGQGNGEDKAYAITIDKFSNIYVVGYSSGVTSQHDITIVKYSPRGDSLWVRTYNGTGNGDDEAYSVITDNDANVYVIGYTTGINGNTYICTIKYNDSGDQKWVRIYNSEGNGGDKAYAITIDRSNNIYITGYSTRSSIDFITIKYKPNGQMQWVSFFNNEYNGEDKAYAITIDKTSNVYVTGYSTMPDGSTAYATVKYNEDGIQEWVSYYQPTAGLDNKAQAIAVDRKGNIYVTGGSDSTSSGSMDYATVKYSSTGAQLWVARYNGQANGIDIANSLVITKEDNGNGNNGNDYIYITGQSKVKDMSSLYYHYTTIKYNSSADVEWMKIYTTIGLEDIASQVVLDNQGNTYITGYSFITGRSSGYATLKYNSSGVQQWVATYNGHSGNPGRLNMENTEKSGLSTSENSGRGLVSTVIPEKFYLYQNSPNPFNPSTKIKFDVSKTAKVKIAVYNVLGVQISVLLNNVLTQGQYEIEFYPNNITSGVYFLEMTTADFRDVKKLLYIK